jgi:hypothetical protein
MRQYESGKSKHATRAGAYLILHLILKRPGTECLHCKPPKDVVRSIKTGQVTNNKLTCCCCIASCCRFQRSCTVTTCSATYADVTDFTIPKSCACERVQSNTQTGSLWDHTCTCPHVTARCNLPVPSDLHCASNMSDTDASARRCSDLPPTLGCANWRLLHRIEQRCQPYRQVSGIRCFASS